MIQSMQMREANKPKHQVYDPKTHDKKDAVVFLRTRPEGGFIYLVKFNPEDPFNQSEYVNISPANVNFIVLKPGIYYVNSYSFNLLQGFSLVTNHYSVTEGLTKKNKLIVHGAFEVKEGQVGILPELDFISAKKGITPMNPYIIMHREDIKQIMKKNRHLIEHLEPITFYKHGASVKTNQEGKPYLDGPHFSFEPNQKLLLDLSK